MRIVLLFASFFCLSFGVLKAQELEFVSEEHDFGFVERKVEVSHSFRFRNTGDAPLLIDDVRPSCGCTAVEYSREAIAPGEESEIEVSFKSKRKGIFRLYISVYSNAKTDPERGLLIRGEVQR